MEIFQKNQQAVLKIFKSTRKHTTALTGAEFPLPQLS